MTSCLLIIYQKPEIGTDNQILDINILNRDDKHQIIMTHKVYYGASENKNKKNVRGGIKFTKKTSGDSIVFVVNQWR